MIINSSKYKIDTGLESVPNISFRVLSPSGFPVSTKTVSPGETTSAPPKKFSKGKLTVFKRSPGQKDCNNHHNDNFVFDNISGLKPYNDVVEPGCINSNNIYKHQNFLHANEEPLLDNKKLLDRQRLIEQKVKLLEDIYKSTSKENFLSENVKKTIQKIGERLLNKSDVCGVGTILREVSKSVFSRPVLEPEFKQNEPFIFLWSTLEEARTGNMLKSQYPGAKDYFRAAYYEDFFNDQAMQEEQDKIIDIIQKKIGNIPREEARKIAEESGFVRPFPKHIQYVKALLYEHFKGKETDWNSTIERPNWLQDKDVIEALNKTKKDYREIVKLKKNLFGLQSLSEKETVELTEKAYFEVRDKLWPIYKELFEKDLEKLKEQSQQSGQGQQDSAADAGEQGAKGQPAGESQQNGQSQQVGQSQQGGQLQQGSSVPSQGKNDSGSTQNDGKADKKEDYRKPGSSEIAREVLDEIDRQLSGKLEGTDEAKHSDRDGKDNNGEDGAGDKTDGSGSNAAAKDGKASSDSNDGAGDKADGVNGKDAGHDAKKAGEGSNQNGSSKGDSGGDGRSITSVDDVPLEELLRRKRLAEEESSQNMTQYQNKLSGVFDQTQELAGILNNVFEKNSKPHYLRGQKKPGVVDIPAVVQAAARAAKGEFVADPPIYKKREDPVKKDHAVVFVLDHSGSMDGEKIEEALKAWIMSAEALEQVHVPWSLIVFSDEHKIVKEFDDQWDDIKREKALSDIDSYMMGSTNDSAAIKPALEMVKKRNCTGTKLILVITDGQGDEKNVRELVKEADNDKVTIVGIGIDAAMEYVKEVYIHNAFAKNIESLPSVLGTAITERFQLSYK